MHAQEIELGKQIATFLGRQYIGRSRTETSQERIEKIIDKVETVVPLFCHVSLSEINTKTRKREVVMARQMMHTVLRISTAMSLSTIGLRTGKDHATVMYSVKTLKGLYKVDRSFRETFNRLLIRLDLYEMREKMQEDNV